MSSGFSIVPDNLLKQMVSNHGSSKLGLIAKFQKEPNHPLAVPYHAVGKVVQQLQTDTLLKLHNSSPQIVASFLKSYFWTVPVVASAVYLKGHAFSYHDLFAGAAICQLSSWDSEQRNKSFVQDFAIAGFARHSLGLVLSAIDCVVGRDPVAGVHAAYNALCAAKLALIIIDKNAST